MKKGMFFWKQIVNSGKEGCFAKGTVVQCIVKKKPPKGGKGDRYEFFPKDAKRNP